jgi:hypothetical protein
MDAGGFSMIFIVGKNDIIISRVVAMENVII